MRGRQGKLSKTEVSEKLTENGKLCFLRSGAIESCVSNVLIQT